MALNWFTGETGNYYMLIARPIDNYTISYTCFMGRNFCEKKLVFIILDSDLEIRFIENDEKFFVRKSRLHYTLKALSTTNKNADKRFSKVNGQKIQLSYIIFIIKNEHYQNS